MSDYLLTLSRNRTAKNVIKKLGLPIPLPTPLKRTDGPWSDELLEGKHVLIDDSTNGPLVTAIRDIIDATGGKAHVAGDAGLSRLDGLVLDGSGLKESGDLTKVYEFLHTRIKALGSSGRVVIIGKDPEAVSDPEVAAVQESFKGLVKSLGKELGKRGTTTHLIYMPAKGASKEQLAGTLAFVLSSRSAFVSGQVYRLSNTVAAPESLQLGQTLTGKLALVTGAAQGIGRAIAERLAEEGAKVICVDRDAELEKLNGVSSTIGGVSLPIDLLTEGAARQIKKEVEALGGKLDILVNNAGITRDRTLGKMSKDWWNQTIDINLKVAMELTDELTNGAMNAKGRVICMSSIAGIAGNMGQTNYASAKSGLIGYVRAKAPKLAGQEITINAIAPGFIETRMTQAIPMAVREVARRFNALSQAGEPEDIGEMVVFLASQGAAPLTGQCIRVCGLNLIGA